MTARASWLQLRETSRSPRPTERMRWYGCQMRMTDARSRRLQRTKRLTPSGRG